MFGKLVKYDIKSAGKWYLLLYIAALLSSVILGVGIRVLSTSDTGGGTFEAILFLLLTLIVTGTLFGLLFATLFLTINRFYRNVYGPEGYLTLTLPVNAHHIILSKLAAALLWNISAFLIFTLSMFLLFLPNMTSEIGQFLVSLPQYINSIQEKVSIPLMIISLLTSQVSGILMMYLAMSIGQLFQNRRGLMGVVAYFIIYIVSITITTFFIPNDIYTSLFSQHYFIFVLIESLVSIGIFYTATHYLMTHRLNLQ